VREEEKVPDREEIEGSEVWRELRVRWIEKNE
jgi:hypothetical protein